MVSISVSAYRGLLITFPSPVMTRRMGRPAMNLEETKVRLTAGAKARIITLVGDNQMATFIRHAVDEAIRRAESEKQKANGRSD